MYGTFIRYHCQWRQKTSRQRKRRRITGGMNEVRHVRRRVEALDIRCDVVCCRRLVMVSIGCDEAAARLHSPRVEVATIDFDLNNFSLMAGGFQI